MAKIDCEVLEAKNHGDKLFLRLQGRKPGAADWKPWLSLQIEVDYQKSNLRALHIGRRVMITVEPR